MFDQKLAAEEAERFLQYFDSDDPVHKAVNAVNVFDADSLDSKILVIENGNPSQAEEAAEQCSVAMEISAGYFAAMGKDSTRLKNLDEKANYLGESEDRFLESIELGFDHVYGLLMEAESRLGRSKIFDEASAARKEAGKRLNVCKTYIELAGTNEAEIRLRVIRNIEARNSRVKRLQSEIEQVYESYKSMELNADNVAGVKSRVRSGIIKSDLVKRCRSDGFVEGLIHLGALEKEVSYVLRNIDDVKRDNNGLARDIERLKSGLEYIKQLGDDASTWDLERLGVLTQTNPDKYKASTEIYLGSRKSEYKELADAVLGAVGPLDVERKQKQREQQISGYRKEVAGLKQKLGSEKEMYKGQVSILKGRIEEAEDAFQKIGNCSRPTTINLGYFLETKGRPKSPRLNPIYDCLIGKHDVEYKERFSRLCREIEQIPMPCDVHDYEWVESVFKAVDYMLDHGFIGNIMRHHQDTKARFRESSVKYLEKSRDFLVRI